MASGSCAPHQQVEQMAAPTEAQCIKKTLANGEPSTHGAKQTDRALPPSELVQVNLEKRGRLLLNSDPKSCLKRAKTA